MSMDSIPAGMESIALLVQKKYPTWNTINKTDKPIMTNFITLLRRLSNIIEAKKVYSTKV